MDVCITGHRGYKAKYPENTLLSFQKAIELGVDMIEFDLRFSKDDVVMIMHDETIDRTTNGSGLISDFTCDELKQLDAGGWFGKAFEGLKIPTFKELCELLKQYPHVLLNVEIKKGPRAIEVADAAVMMLKQYGYLDRCKLTSFDADVVAHVHDTYQIDTQGFLDSMMINFVPGENGTYSKMTSIGVSLKKLTPAFVQTFQSMGLKAGCFCPDTDQQVYFAFGCGVNTVTCNDPVPALRFRQLIAQKNNH